MHQGSRIFLSLSLVVLLLASVTLFAQGKAATRITSVELTVKVDDTGSCMLSANGMIQTTGKGKLWYRFEGPVGSTFDFGPEETREIRIGSGMGVGKGIKFKKDIAGRFVLKAAMIGPNGKPGAIVASKPVPANYSCDNGTQVAHVTGSAFKPVIGVKSVKVEATPESYENCKIQVSTEIETSGIKKLWYKFEAPAGATFDNTPEMTVDLDFGSNVGFGKSLSFTKDIHGTFFVKAAGIDPSGKKTPIVSSKAVPAHYTCGNGTQVAKPIPPVAPSAPTNLNVTAR